MNQENKTEKYSLRGRVFVGTVTSNKMHKTIVVEWNRKIKVPKYDRYQIKKKKIAAHLPENITANVGDMVKIMESRPISKTKSFVVVENLGFNKEHIIKKDTKDNANLRIHKKTEEAE